MVKMMDRRLVISLISALIALVHGLDNGVALTPPMGWLSWERFECNTNCAEDPDNCISERLLKQMADVMVSEGYKAAGYEYVAIDDCWLAKERDDQGHLQPDPDRFPSGMRALADYMHERGLKLGIYEDVGTKTCAGYPGCQDHMQQDAQTFADWQIDMLKFDGCHADIDQFNRGFPEMKEALNATGRHIVYSCEWPMYAKAHGAQVDQELVASTCNMFRQLTDIYDSWGSVIGMIEYFGDDPGNFSGVAGPSAWNDPDQVVVGNFGLSPDQERVQMALFAILASPLMVSADFRAIRAESKALLLNKGVISISQDPLGIQGHRIKQMDKISIWTRSVSPRGSVAVAFLNTQQHGYPVLVQAKLSDLGLNNSAGYDVIEVFDGDSLGHYNPDDVFTCRVNPTGVYLIRATIVNTQKPKQSLNNNNSEFRKINTKSSINSQRPSLVRKEDTLPMRWKSLFPSLRVINP